jgi:catechol 2,3-dioxygenase-like lactoylglutathione lyase family enzyme
MIMAAVRYIVSDVDAAVAFYSTLLEFELVEQFGLAMAIMRRDDLTLWLAGPVSSAARPMPDGRQPVPGGWNRIVIDVADIERSVERLRASGIRLRNEIVTGPGGRQILVEDPSGNAIELFQPLR